MKSIRKCVSVLLAFLLVFGYACAVAEADEWICPDCGTANTMNFCFRCGGKNLRKLSARIAEHSFPLMKE